MSYTFGDFEIDVSALELRERGAVVPVQPKALSVLVYLVRNRDRVVSQKELLEAVWSGVNVSPNSLAQAITSIRRLLHDNADEIVRTIHSRGYRFVASVEQRRDVSAVRDVPTDVAFVGRAEIMGRLLEGLEEARSGRGGIHLVTGPAGIGKTRTISELSKVAQSRSITVRRARCFEDGEGQPLALWRDITAGEGEPVFLPEVDPFQSFQRIRSWLETKGRLRPPVLVILDDLNWSDAPSLLALKYLTRDIETIPIQIVAAYRDAPVAPELARVLGAICRVDPARRIELERLDLPSTLELAKALLGAEVSRVLVEELWQKAEGNPLYLTQMFHVLKMEGIDGPVSRLTSTLLAPETVKEAIAGHLEHLSSPCREMLIAASVLGLAFKLDLLAETMRREPSSLVEALDEACRVRVVVPVRGARDTFCFHHKVVRDVLYRRLGLLEKTKMHRAAGDAAARLYDAGSIDNPLMVADHWLRGAAVGDLDAPVAWLARQAKTRWNSGLPDQGIALMERALELTAPPIALAAETDRALEVTLQDLATAGDARVTAIVRKFQRRRQLA